MPTLGLGEILSLASALAWAAAVVLFKKSGEVLPPFSLNFVKNLLAMSLLGLTVWVWNGGADLPAMSARDAALTALSGLLGIAIGDTLYFRALNTLGAARMGVAQTLYSPFAILLSVLLLDEGFAAPQTLGVAGVAAGVLLVAKTAPAGQIGRAAQGRGFLLAGLSVLMMAAGVVVTKPLLLRHDFLWIVFLRTAAGVLGMLLVIVVTRRWSSMWQAYRAARHWPVIVAGSILGTYLSMLLWLAGYKYTSIPVAATLNEMATIFTLILAVLFLRERVGPRQVCGCLLAVAGVIAVVQLAPAA